MALWPFARAGGSRACGGAHAMAQSGTRAPLVAIVTLGCPKNVVDSEQIASLLEAAGARVCTDPAEARVAVVNTCGFIDPAKEESIDAILEVAELKAQGGLETLIVAGCLSQRYGEQLRRELPEADIVLGIDPRGAAREALRALGMEPALPAGCNLRSRRFTPPWWAYLRISEGCDNRCAYCAIPAIRGPLVSRPMDEILAEARRLLQSGVKELNLIAQDTTAYGADRGEAGLHVLLRRLCGLPGRKWVRLLYTHPAHYSEELIETLADADDICPYLDIPLQHINDRILRRMGRGVSRGDIERLLQTLRARVPGLVLRTSLIVGFPGEGEAEFRELLEFVRQARFERLGAFVYSREEGTPAASFDGQVPEKVKRERYHELMSIQRDIAVELAAGRAGEHTSALVERAPGPDGVAVARSPSEAPDVDPVLLIRDAEGVGEGELVEVEIVGSEGYDCVARLLRPRRRA